MDKVQLQERRHPLYVEHYPFWRYYHDHYHGGPMYPAKNNPMPIYGQTIQVERIQAGNVGMRFYVWQYPLEMPDNYMHRLARATYCNIISPVVDLYAATVGKQERVIIESAGMDDFLDDADGQGHSLLQVMNKARIDAAVYGHTFVMIDEPRASAPILTQADVKAQGLRPYITLVTPEHMLNWRLDSNGYPLEVLFQVHLENESSILDQGASDQPVTEYRHWTRTSWATYRIINGAIAEVDSGTNPLGRVPVIPLYHKHVKPFMGESLIKDAAKIGQLITNWLSGLDEAMEKQMFAIPFLKSNKEPKAVGVGVSTVLHLNPDDNEEFGYAAPEVAPFEACWTAFYRMIQLANRHMGIKSSPITDDQPQQQSGISKAWDFYECEKILAMMALNEQETVKSVLEIAAAWNGRKWTGSVQYPTAFDLTTLADDIANLLQLQICGAPRTARRELMRRITSKALPSLPDDVRAEIDKELEAFGATPPAPKPETTGPAAPMRPDAIIPNAQVQ